MAIIIVWGLLFAAMVVHIDDISFKLDTHYVHGISTGFATLSTILGFVFGISADNTESSFFLISPAVFSSYIAVNEFISFLRALPRDSKD